MKSKKIDKTKMKILNALNDNRKRILNIEISRSAYMKGKWNIRIGDIIGSTELSNAEMKEVLKEIEEEMGSLENNN